MDKKPLIVVSICSVVLLVLGSLGNVVGYQSVKPNTICDSPLFNIRTNRATNNEHYRVITSDYLGQGLNTIQIPQRHNRTTLIQKYLDRIRTMDDDTFNRFVSNAVNQIKQKDYSEDINIKNFINILNKLRKNKQSIIVNNYTNDDRITFVYDYTPTICWFPWCLIIILITTILLKLGFTANIGCVP